jgi:hypothetical protein
MSTSREYEAANIIAPLRNATGLHMKAQANIVVSNAGVSQGLSGLFGRAVGDGHFLTLQADGAKVYVQFAADSSGTIDAFATGNGPTICYPIPDGVSMPVVPIGGREVGTGVATTVRYNFINAKVASGGVATGYLRLYLSSLAPGQNAEEFGKLRP